MISPKTFPAILTALDMAAGLCYFAQGDIKRAVYWFAAATLTICVTV